ncbi:cation transporter [Pseudogracilibacillus sp. SO30301A]|uniref:cation transporter n=1 Tax=Pseudogracilibacillus sp. SO30301A TaxID=3098291 RepID=UPI00300E6615
MNVVLVVKGMNCENCVRSVTGALEGLYGVEHVEAHLDAGKVNVRYDQSVIDLKTICDKIEEQGYDVVR